MRNERLTTDMLKERLVALEATKNNYSVKHHEKIQGEIKYIKRIIQSEEFTTR